MMTRRLAGAAILANVALCLVGACAAHAAQKEDTWVEVRTPNFIVISNAGEKQARRTAEQFELIRAVYGHVLKNARTTTATPLVVLAAKNESTLKTLLPQFWEVKDSRHPAGIYVGGPERNYVALRLDAQGEMPFHIVYHEYFHLLARLNFRALPLWLSEGLADFFGHAVIQGKKVLLGRPSENSILLLRERKLMPLEELFAVDHRSPYYNEREKTSIFYAQSWALVHYLMLSDRTGTHRAKIDALIAQMRQNAAPAEAHRRVFGDLKLLNKQIEGYIRRWSMLEFVVDAPADIDEKRFPFRVLPPAESLAVRADFHSHMGRPQEARALAERALALDANLPLVYEVMGVLHLRQGQPDEAAPWFAKAVERDSKSYFAHFYQATLLMGSREPDARQRAERALRRTIELNPQFSPAYSTLAMLLSQGDGKLDEALTLARKAAEMEPGNAALLANLGHLLLRTDRPDEARQVVQQLESLARTGPERSLALGLRSAVDDYAEFKRRAKEAEQYAARANEELRRQREEAAANKDSPPPSEDASGASVGAARAKSAPKNARKVSAEGVVAAVTCSGFRMELTLDFGGLTLKVESPNYTRIEYLTTRWNPPANFDPCRHLKGRTADVQYVVVQEKPFVGEIASIEVKK